MVNRHCALLVLSVGILPVSAAAAEDQADAIVASIVRQCVSKVHATKVPQYQSYMKRFYDEFDAFYNPATKGVENNATTVGAQKAFFAFNKCMTEKGVPLSNPEVAIMGGGSF